MMQPIVIRLPDEEKRLLKIEAQNQGVPVSEVARKAIKTYLRKKPKKLSGVGVLLKWATRKEKPVKKYAITSLNYKEYLYGSKSKKFGYLWHDKKNKEK